MKFKITYVLYFGLLLTGYLLGSFFGLAKKPTQRNDLTELNSRREFRHRNASDQNNNEPPLVRFAKIPGAISVSESTIYQEIISPKNNNSNVKAIKETSKVIVLINLINLNGKDFSKELSNKKVTLNLFAKNLKIGILGMQVGERRKIMYVEGDPKNKENIFLADLTLKYIE